MKARSGIGIGMGMGAGSGEWKVLTMVALPDGTAALFRYSLRHSDTLRLWTVYYLT